MIDFIYDTFRLYLAKDNQFVKRYIVSSREKAHEIIDNVKDDYDGYLIIGHINITNEDVPLEHEYIEHTYTRKRKK